MYIFLLYTEYFFPQLYSHDSVFPTATIGRGASSRGFSDSAKGHPWTDEKQGWEARPATHIISLKSIYRALSPVETVLALTWPLTPL